MKKTSFITLAVAVGVLSAQPGFCQKKVKYTVENTSLMEIKQTQNGWNKVPPTYVETDSLSPSASGGSGKLPLPGTPMGAAVRQPGDYLYNKKSGGGVKRQGKGLAGLPDTRMGAAVGMATDSIGRPGGAPTQNAIGLPGAPLGAHVGTAGDTNRSDLGKIGSPRNDFKPVNRDRIVTVRIPQKANGGQSAQPSSGSSYAASYGAYDQSVKKRNY